MSLALFRDRIEAGELDETVRAHLRGCDECRAYYDHLALTARALGDDGANEEKARLVNALPLPWRGEGRGEGRPGIIYAAAAAILVLVATVLLLPKRNEVTMRGGNDAEEAAPFSLRLYGKDFPGQPVHLIADFPGAKEATVGLRSEVQFFVKPGSKAVLVETRGAGRTVTGRSEPSAEELVAAGKAFPIGPFGPGSLEVCVALASPEHQTVDDAVKAGSTKYCSTLVVSP